jgi:hypothetical protein
VAVAGGESAEIAEVEDTTEIEEAALLLVHARKLRAPHEGPVTTRETVGGSQDAHRETCESQKRLGN